MHPPAAPQRTAPIVLDDAIDAVADIEQARATAADHRRLERYHASRAERAERVIDSQVVVAAEALARLRARRRLLSVAPPPVPAGPAAAEIAATRTTLAEAA